MTADEIFSLIASHMAKGLLIHNQLACAFNFLNLCGYKKCHEYHYFEEAYHYRCLKDFYVDNYGKLIVEKQEEAPEIIPSNWFKHVKGDVDANTKRAAIKDLMKIWVDWEKETKKLLENCYKQLYEQDEICAALKIAKCLQDVSKELSYAEEKQIDLDSSGYDMSIIIDKQNSLKKKYQEKIKHIYKDDE